MSDAAFGKVFAWMIGGMVALTVLLIILAYAMGGDVGSRVSDVQANATDLATVERVAPVASIAIGEVAAQAASAVEEVSGDKVYQTACAACHAAGVAGAPKFGDAAAWEPRLAQGDDALYDHAISGFNAMPAKGGNTNLSDDAVKAAVDYMLGREQAAAPAPADTTEQAQAEPAPDTSMETGDTQQASAASDIDGAAVYQASCSVCHAAGVAGAPKFGVAADWQPRIAQGNEMLYEHSLNGLNAMPAKGGNVGLSDDEVRAAVDHMVNALN